MKISQKTLSLGAAIAIILLSIGKMDLYHYYPDKDFNVNGYSAKSTDLDRFTDSIREADNKLQNLKREKEIYTQGFAYYSGYTLGMLGIVKLDFPQANKESKEDFIRLANIGLRYDDTEFHGKTYLAYQIKNGQPYIITKKLLKVGNRNTVVNVYKKVGYRYSASDNSIFIPVKSKLWIIFVMVLGLLFVVLISGLFLFVAFKFSNFLLSIAKNNAFDERNVNRLRDMSLGLFILALSPYILNFIIYLIFIANFSSEGVVMTRSFFKHDYYTLIFAILSYLLYHAFEKARVLEAESELTI